MMKIGKLIIMEWSHSGACRVWEGNDPNAPSLHKRSYTTDSFMNEPSRGEPWRITHDSRDRWEMKLNNIISKYSGIRRTV